MRIGFVNQKPIATNRRIAAAKNGYPEEGSSPPIAIKKGRLDARCKQMWETIQTNAKGGNPRKTDRKGEVVMRWGGERWVVKKGRRSGEYLTLCLGVGFLGRGAGSKIPHGIGRPAAN